MTIPALALSKSSVGLGLVRKIEIRKAATGSLQDVGLFANLSMSANQLSQECDPAGSQQVWAIEYMISFDLLQTAKAAELAAFMAGTEGTGFIETDAELKLTYANARTLTLGSITGYPLRLVCNYTMNEDVQVLSCSGTTVEPISGFAAKVG